MWVTTTVGFFSAVAHRDRRNCMMIRARAREDLENLAEMLDIPLSRIEDTPVRADYPARLTITRKQWKRALARFADNVDYDNFKNAVADVDHVRAHTYHGVWAAYLRIEREHQAPTRFQFPAGYYDDDFDEGDDGLDLRDPEGEADEDYARASYGPI